MEVKDYTENPDEFMEKYRDGRIYSLVRGNGFIDFFEHSLTRQEQFEEKEKQLAYGKAFREWNVGDERPSEPIFKKSHSWSIKPPKSFQDSQPAPVPSPI